MSAPTLIQSSSESSGSGTVSLTLAGVTAGSTIVVCVWQVSAGTRTYTATNYTVAAETAAASNRQATILYRESVASGTHNITVNANTGTVTVNAQAFEFSACTFDEGDVVIEAGNNATHDCADPGLSTPADALIVSGGTLNASGVTLTATSGATRLNSAANNALWQYETSDSGFTNERSNWANSTSRTAVSVSAAFQAPSSGYTLVCDGATFAETGQDANLIASRLLLADNASVTLSGQDVSLIAARLLTADQASFSLSGQTANLTASRLLTADNATYSLSGQDATLDYGSSITYTLTCDLGTYALSGQDASLLASRLLTLDNGTFALSGQDATLSYSGQAEVPYLELDFASNNAATGTLTAISATGSLVSLQATGTLVVTDTET